MFTVVFVYAAALKMGQPEQELSRNESFFRRLQMDRQPWPKTTTLVLLGHRSSTNRRLSNLLRPLLTR